MEIILNNSSSKSSLKQLVGSSKEYGHLDIKCLILSSFGSSFGSTKDLGHLLIGLLVFFYRTLYSGYVAYNDSMKVKANLLVILYKLLNIHFVTGTTVLTVLFQFNLISSGAIVSEVYVFRLGDKSDILSLVHKIDKDLRKLNVNPSDLNCSFVLLFESHIKSSGDNS